MICYTSCPSVELFLNGKSYGEKAYLYPAFGIDEWPNFDLSKPHANTDDLFLAWDVPFEKGELIAIGYDREGHEIARHEVRTFKEVTNIKLKCDISHILADGRDVAQIEISLEDQEGNLVITAENELTVDVSGAGHLLVLENGNGADHTLGKCKTRKAHFGLLLAVVQSNRNQRGVIKIEVSGKGLQPQIIEIISK